jgi:hypothetical protein
LYSLTGLASVSVVLVIPLLGDIYWLSKPDFAILGNYRDKDSANQLILTVREINPNDATATLDVKLITDAPADEKDHQIETWINNGSYSRLGKTYSISVASELNRTSTILKGAQQLKIGDGKRAIYTQDGLKLKATIRRPGYLFPFDSYYLSLIPIMTDQTSGDHVGAIVGIDMADPRFIHSYPLPVPLLSRFGVEDTVPETVIVSFERPYYAKVSVILPLVVSIASIGLTFYRVVFTNLKMIDSIQIFTFTFTILVALPSLRNLIIPSNLVFTPCFDFPVVAIWTVSLFTLLVSIYRQHIQASSSPNSAN